jgi:hypothetical protein
MRKHISLYGISSAEDEKVDIKKRLHVDLNNTKHEPIFLQESKSLFINDMWNDIKKYYIEYLPMLISISNKYMMLRDLKNHIPINKYQTTHHIDNNAYLRIYQTTEQKYVLYMKEWRYATLLERVKYYNPKFKHRIKNHRWVDRDSIVIFRV